MIDAPDARRLVVMFPRDNGSRIALQQLGEQLHRLLGEEFAVIIVDLEEILRRAPAEEIIPFLNNRCVQLFDE